MFFGNKVTLGPLALSVIASAALVSTASAQGQKAASSSLVLNTKSKASIVLPKSATLPEQTAAGELKDYLTRITGGNFTVVREGAKVGSPAIYVGATNFARRSGIEQKRLKPEEWVLRSKGNALIVEGGGPRGALYATYHLLEDQAGVHWWNPWEESVPTRKTLNFTGLNRRGQPVFDYRDIYMIYGNDAGRFAARSRLNREGDAYYILNAKGDPTNAAKYGGTRDYGPPYHVHTLYHFLPPEKYYDAHPDWYIKTKEGKPGVYDSQLAFSNPEMRQEFLKVLRETIRKSNADAKAKGLPAPDVFSVSQQDTVAGFIGSPADAELAKKEGSEAAILLNFINFLADNIKKEFPNVYIDTLAYYGGEKAPKTIRPRDNVIIRLTDTTSNVLLPVTAERNKAHREHVESWGKITKNLRIWDYAITFNYIGLPTPTIHTYPTDFRFWHKNNVKGVFTELESPITADMRDLKVWLYIKMLENPYQDFDALVRTFTDGFYGPAGPMIREYLTALEQEAAKPTKVLGEAKPQLPDVSWFSTPAKHTYLNLNFIRRAQGIFDRAATSVAGNPVLSRRVRHARMPLDRATTLLFTKLFREWRRTGGSPTTMPLNRDAIAARYLQSWNEQIDMRILPVEQAKERETAKAEVTGLTSVPVYLEPPAKFRDLPPLSVITYGPSSTRRFEDRAKVVADAAAEGGYAARLEIPEAELEKYKLPMPWGVYDTVSKGYPLTSEIKPADIPGPGYHWFKMGNAKLTGNDYLYFFWSWNIQIDLDDAYAEAPGAEFEVWANIKFEGPAFPHGKAEEKNAISVGPVVLIKK